MEPRAIYSVEGAIAALSELVTELVTLGGKSIRDITGSFILARTNLQDKRNPIEDSPQSTSTDMEYLCYLANASLTLRLVEHLHSQTQLKVSFITVINQFDGWVVRIKLKHQVSPQQDGDFRAFLSELGMSYSPPKHLEMALVSLASGQSPVDVMRRYRVAIVCHGQPEQHHIKVFRQQFISELGYCPQTLT